MPVAEGPWLEVNAAPRTSPAELLLALVDPLVHDRLAGTWRRWFYFWEPDLRLRFQWAVPDDAPAHRATVATSLDEAVTAGLVESWFEGNHGQPGSVYAGEAETYGASVWDLVTKDWTNASELALALIRVEAAGSPADHRGLDFQWSRRVHLFSNQLGKGHVDEAVACLRQAGGYLRISGQPGDPVQARLHKAIDAYLAGRGQG